MTVRTGFVKGLRKSGRNIHKFSSNITGAMGGGISDVFISPITALTDNASDFLSSPTLMIGVGLIGVIAVKTIFKASDTANKALNNPGSIRAVAQAVR